MCASAPITVESMKGIPHAYELTWNHTTLRALKLDTNITYLQVQYPGPDHVEKVRVMTELFPDEVIGHLEFIKFDGQIQCAGLPLVRYTTKERLEEIIRIHEENGCPIFNPHRYTLEEGGMKQTDQVQLAFKKETDPKGSVEPRQDDRLGEPRLRFLSGEELSVSGTGGVCGGGGIGDSGSMPGCISLHVASRVPPSALPGISPSRGEIRAGSATSRTSQNRLGTAADVYKDCRNLSDDI